MTDQSAYNQKLIIDFRATRGDPNWPFAGRPLLLLTTTGARTGQPRTTPMMYIPDDDGWLVIASNAGAPKHPDWYHNLVAHPDVTIEIGAETHRATAQVIIGPERQKLWSQITEQYPFFADHQAKVAREIPVIRLQRKESIVSNRARGTFEVKLTPQPLADSAADPALGRLAIDKQFRGDLEATSRGEMLSAGTSVEGSAGYVAIERVSGTLNGRSGSFVLQHNGTMNRGAAHLTITVVPDSGTDQLAGLAGTMSIAIADGQHSYDFEYTL